MKGIAFCVLSSLALVACGAAGQGPDTTSSATPSSESSLETAPERGPSVTAPEGTDPESPPPSALPGAPTPSTSLEEAEIPEGFEPVVSEVVADLAGRLGDRGGERRRGDLAGRQSWLSAAGDGLHPGARERNPHPAVFGWSPLRVPLRRRAGAVLLRYPRRAPPRGVGRLLSQDLYGPDDQSVSILTIVCPIWLSL